MINFHDIGQYRCSPKLRRSMAPGDRTSARIPIGVLGGLDGGGTGDPLAVFGIEAREPGATRRPAFFHFKLWLVRGAALSRAAQACFGFPRFAILGASLSLWRRAAVDAHSMRAMTLAVG
jgi:hypothetical protein